MRSEGLSTALACLVRSAAAVYDPLNRGFTMRMRMMVLAGVMAVSAPAASAEEKVLFENTHVRLVEVTLPPGQHQLPTLPYASVWMVDAAWPTVEGLDNPKHIVGPDKVPYPWCRVQAAQPARTVRVSGSFPQHYYRIDYKRVDGKAYAQNWQAWYAKEFAPSQVTVRDLGDSLKDGKPFSKEWPYDIRYSAVTAAPANHRVLFQDAHIEMLEVVIRPGETENMHGHPYRSIFADDGGFGPLGADYGNATLRASAGPPWGEMSAPPPGADFPICFSATPELPHRVSVRGGPPQHFYRVHFKRIDGEDVSTRWREWYPAGR